MGYKCFACLTQFGTAIALTAHCLATGHDDGWECKDCLLLFRDRAQFTQHQDEAHGQSYCEVCDRYFVDHLALQQHDEQKHNEEEEDEQGDEEEEEEEEEEDEEDEEHKEQEDEGSDMPLYTCRCCPKVCLTANGLSHHQNTVHHQCPVCKIFFASIKTRDKHYANEPVFDCTECTARSHTQKKLTKHFNNKHLCKLCKMVFADPEARDAHRLAGCPNFKEHSKALQAEAPYTHRELSANVLTRSKSPPRLIPHSPFAFTQKAAAQKRMLSNHAFLCEECKKPFGSAEEREAHRLAAHSINCGKCTNVFQAEVELHEHIQKKHSIGCHRCSEVFDNLIDQNKHLCNTHLCPFCWTVADNANLRQEHIKSSHGFKCQKCQESFLTKDEMEAHYQLKHSLPCEHCEERFDGLALLIIHVNTTHRVTGVDDTCILSSWIKCKKCNAAFEGAEELEKHEAAYHTHYCHQCPGLSFINEPSFKQHQAQFHSSSPSPTDIPSQSPYSELLEELRTHAASSAALREAGTQTTIHRCDACNAVFDDEAELQRHLNHSPFHGPKALECYECGLEFATQLALHAHLESKLHNVRWVLSLISFL